MDMDAGVTNVPIAPIQSVAPLLAMETEGLFWMAFILAKLRMPALTVVLPL